MVLIGTPLLRARIMGASDKKFDLASLARRIVADVQTSDPSDEDIATILRECIGLVGREALGIAKKAATPREKLAGVGRLMRDARRFAGSEAVGLSHLHKAAKLNGIEE